MVEEGRISWYPWSVQIYGYELPVARVGPGLEECWENKKGNWNGNAN